MNKNRLALLGVLSLGLAFPAHAQLGPGLTPFGAIQAASTDGAIPAYTGGLAAMSGLPTPTPATGYPDPFAGEKPIFSITSSNMAQYASMLTPGTQALLRRYKDFRVDVYPTHRTASYPAWVLQNIAKNNNGAVEVPNGDGVEGASYGGVPFPVPKDGYQVMWNNILAYQPAYCEEKSESYLVDSSGSVTDLGLLDTTWAEPYYDPSATSLPDNFFEYKLTRFITPAAEAGQLYLLKYPLDFTKSDDVTYFYSPGTRRVRLAPEFKYDTPIASYGGAIDWDEIGLFYGRLNKFDFKLIGEKEMIVPYNDFQFSHTSADAILGPHTLNPDDVRWERHRVWVVDATLKPTERHAYSRWTFYIDEDTWKIVASESYDHSNRIYRVGFLYPWFNYSQGDAMAVSPTFGVYDLSTGSYEISYVQTTDNGVWNCSAKLPDMSNFTPQAIAAQAVR